MVWEALSAKAIVCLWSSLVKRQRTDLVLHGIPTTSQHFLATFELDGKQTSSSWRDVALDFCDQGAFYSGLQDAFEIIRLLASSLQAIQLPLRLSSHPGKLQNPIGMLGHLGCAESS